MNLLDVQLHNKSIGSITLIPGDRSILAFNDEYVQNPDRDTLSLSFKNYHGELITNFRATGPDLHPFFSNLLPEGPLREFLARKMNVKPAREFHLLWGLGEDLPGAIRVIPAEGDALPTIIEENSGGGEKTNEVLRFSLAGVQLKFSAIRSEDRLTFPAKGVGGEWIVKLPSDRFEAVPENEFSFMTIAGMIGIDIPEIQLVDVREIHGIPDGLGRLRDERAFVIKRFDRANNEAVHIEDFAQVFNLRPDDKYGKKSYRNIAYVIGIESDISDLEEFIRRLVFSTLIGNEDMHLKNWSLTYRDKHRPSLSPAYDLLSTIPYIQNKTAALKFSRTNKMVDFNFSELADLADKALVPQKLVLDTAKETVEKFMEIWSKEKSHLFLNKEIIETVEKHLETLHIIDEI